MEFVEQENVEMDEYEEIVNKKEMLENYVESVKHELDNMARGFEEKTQIQIELQTENVQNHVECEIETDYREQVKLELKKNYKLLKEFVAEFNQLAKFIKYNWEILTKLETNRKETEEKIQNLSQFDFEQKIQYEYDLMKQLIEQFRENENELALKCDDVKMKRNHLKQMNEDLESKIEELEKNNWQIEFEMERLNKLGNEQFMNESNELAKKMVDLVNTTQQNKMELKTKIEHLKAMMSKILTSKSMLETEIQAAQDKIEAEDIILNDMNKRIHNVANELIGLEQNNAHFKHCIQIQTEQMKLEREQMKNELNISNDQINLFIENTANLQNEVNDLSMIANNNAILKTKLTIKNKNQDDQLTELQNRLKCSKATFEDNKLKFVNSITELENELNVEKERNKDVISEQELLEKKLTVQKELLVDLENQYQNREQVVIKHEVENNLKIDKLKQVLEHYKYKLNEEKIKKIALDKKSDERLNEMRKGFEKEKMTFIKQTEKHVKEIKTNKRKMLKQREEELQKTKSLYMSKQLQLNEMKAVAKNMDMELHTTRKQIEMIKKENEKVAFKPPQLTMPVVLSPLNETCNSENKTFCSDDISFARPLCTSTPLSPRQRNTDLIPQSFQHNNIMTWMRHWNQEKK